MTKNASAYHRPPERKSGRLPSPFKPNFYSPDAKPTTPSAGNQKNELTFAPLPSETGDIGPRSAVQKCTSYRMKSRSMTACLHGLGGGEDRISGEADDAVKPIWIMSVVLKVVHVIAAKACADASRAGRRRVHCFTAKRQCWILGRAAFERMTRSWSDCGSAMQPLVGSAIEWNRRVAFLARKV